MRHVTHAVSGYPLITMNYPLPTLLSHRYLYTSTQPGVHDYLCNKLYELSESSLDSYLLQLVYLAVSRPGATLERTLVELASRSFRLALKV